MAARGLVTTGRAVPRRRALALLGGALGGVLAGCAVTSSSGPSGPSTRSADAVRADDPGPAAITATSGANPLPAGTPGVGTPAVTIGTKDFPEQFLLGELYAQALRAKGFTVDLQQNLGGTEIIDSAFAAGRIQCYPEYIGEIATTLAGQPPAADALTTYRQAADYEAAARRATLLLATPYQNVDVLVVRREFADRTGARSVTDLAGAGRLRIAAQPPFRTRTSGLAGLQQVYGLTDLDFFAVAPDETYGALDAGQAEVADGFSTDPELDAPTYVELDDPRNIFGFQYVAPVVTLATAAAQPAAFARTCNWVSSQLTVGAVRDMNRQVRLDGADEAAVAHDFLVGQGFR